MTESLSAPENHVRAVFVDLDDRDDPRFMIPLIRGEMEGLQVRRVRPGGDLERPALPIAWIVLIDDRFPGASGPHSFDTGTLRWLFVDAYRIAVDAAEPHMGLYEHFVEESLKGMRLLLIHTVERRRAVWREFSQENSELYGILELVPVLDNPKQHVLPVVTRFDGRAAASQK
jgi:hypothetical protein